MDRCFICKSLFTTDCKKTHMFEHLKHACVVNDPAYLKTCVAAIGDVNHTDSDGVSAAYVAAENGSVLCSVVLEELHANFDKANSKGWSPIHMASQQGHSELVPLLASKVDLNKKSGNNSGSSPLLIACTNGHLWTIDVLLKMGANIATTNNLGQGPVHICCMYGYTACLVLLIAQGANFIAPDTTGMTPIEMAVMFGNMGCIGVLLANQVAMPDLGELPIVHGQIKAYHKQIAIAGRLRRRQVRRCNVPECTSAAKLRACGGCRVSFYCSKEHQREDLGRHEDMCRKYTRMCDFLGCGEKSIMVCELCSCSAYCTIGHREGHAMTHMTACGRLTTYRDLVKKSSLEDF